MAAVAAIGIDFGTAGITIGAARKGGVDILDNEVSNRLTPNFIGFGDKVRSIGESGLNEYARNPKNTVTQHTRFLGRAFDTEEMKAEMEKVVFKCERGENGDVLACATLAGEPKSFPMEHIMAMMLQKLKIIIKNHCGPIKDVVVTCPGYITAFQRQAILDAGTIAGLKIVQVMNEHAASGLAYGISNPYLTAEARNIIIVDWGHANLSVSVQQLIKGKLEVLATSFDRSLGGRDLDSIIVNHFVAEFLAKTKVDLNTKPRSLVKLQAACEKVKKSLSMGPLAPINMECLYEDFDLRSQLERDTLNELAAPLYARIMPTVDQALSDAGLSKDDIHSVEIVGNSCRVPSFQTALKEWFGRELSTTLDAANSVAKGACLQAAILSPAFRVRDFKIVDRTLYPITLVWEPYNATPEQKEEAGKDPENVYDVFQRFNVLPSTKMLTFERLEPFQLVAYYKTPEMLPPGTPACLGTWKVSSIPPPKEGELISRKIKVKARLTLHGTLEVDTAQIWDEFEPEVEPEPPAEPEAPKEGEAEPEGEAKPETEPAAEAEPESAPEAEPMKTDEAPKEEKPKEKKEPKPKTTKSELPMVSDGMPGLPPATLEAIIADETKMFAADQLAVETDKAMNDLESYVLNTRGKIRDEWAGFMDEAAAAAFCAQLEEGENWLYDHWDEDLATYTAKLDSFKAVGDEVAYRATEAQKRPEVISATRQVIDQVKADASSGPEVEKFAHIEQEDKDKVLAECQRVASLLDTKLSEQDALPKSDKPVVTCAEITKWGTDLQSMASPIMNKPKPKPKEPKKKEEPEAAPEAEAGAEAQAEPAAGEAAAETEAPPVVPMDTDAGADLD